jgi:hypothetical protein|eukprot:COSAG02_NODE_125_length_34972_cov_101.069997_23_plen_82_part_00
MIVPEHHSVKSNDNSLYRKIFQNRPSVAILLQQCGPPDISGFRHPGILVDLNGIISAFCILMLDVYCICLCALLQPSRPPL